MYQDEHIYERVLRTGWLDGLSENDHDTILIGIMCFLTREEPQYLAADAYKENAAQKINYGDLRLGVEWLYDNADCIIMINNYTVA